jgi:hypothetical protein
MNRYAITGMALPLVMTSIIQAQEPDRRLQFGGFGSLGAVSTDSHQVAYPRDTSAYSGAVDHLDLEEDSRLGLQGHLRLARTLGATLQVVSRYRYNATYMPDITKAELVWNPAPGTQAHAGRMNDESHLDSNVGYDYLWARPPVEVYSSLAAGAMDGVDVVQALPLRGKASLILKAYGGTSAGRIAIWRLGNMNFNGGREYGVVTLVLDGPWRIGLSAGQIVIPSDFPAPISQLPADFAGFAHGLEDPRLVQSGQQFSIKGAVERGWGAILTWEEDPVQVEGQFTRTYTNKWLLTPTDSGCVYLGFKLGRVEPYAMYARTWSRPLAMPYLGEIPQLAVPEARALAPGIAGLLDSLHRDQTTWSGGERWDFARRAALKVQIDWVHSAQGSAPLSLLQPGFNGNLKVFTVLVDFTFGQEAERGFKD